MELFYLVVKEPLLDSFLIQGYLSRMPKKYSRLFSILQTRLISDNLFINTYIKSKQFNICDKSSTIIYNHVYQLYCVQNPTDILVCIEFIIQFVRFQKLLQLVFLFGRILVYFWGECAILHLILFLLYLEYFPNQLSFLFV